MRPRLARALVLTIAALTVTAPGAAPPETVEIVLPARTIELRPSRDVAVGELWIQIRCQRKAAGDRRFAGCRGFAIDGEAVDTVRTLELAPTSKNTFRLPEKRIRFEKTAGAHLCIAVRAIFAGVSHRTDYELFANPGDRYSLVSYCTVCEVPEGSPNRRIFAANRVDSLEQLAERLARPIEIPLRAE